MSFNPFGLECKFQFKIVLIDMEILFVNFKNGNYSVHRDTWLSICRVMVDQGHVVRIIVKPEHKELIRFLPDGMDDKCVITSSVFSVYGDVYVTVKDYGAGTMMYRFGMDKVLDIITIK